mgnify:FL=1
MISKFSRHFFWLFSIIGFFLSLILLAGDYFSHQIFLEEYDRQKLLCIESSQMCNMENLIAASESILNANQLKMIELNELIVSYPQYIKKTLIIFIIFIFIGSLSAVVNFIYDIGSKMKLLR